MPDIVFLNGEFVPACEAKISVFDHGFLYGDGFFETMRSYHGRIFLLEEHLDRLFCSARALEMKIPWERKDIKRFLHRMVEINGDNILLRLTVSRGPGPAGIDPRLYSKPTIVITSREAAYNERWYNEGARAVFVRTLRNLAGATLPEVKSLNFLNNILAKQETVRAGADEGFMLNYRGQVTEGTVSNVFAVRDGCLATPSLDCGLLAGITRLKVLQLASEYRIPAMETVLLKEDFWDADEVFYTNSGSEIVPVTTLDGMPAGTGTPGRITAFLLEKYRRHAYGNNNQKW